MDKFTAGLERAIANLVEGAIKISQQMLAGELDTRKTKKRKPKTPKKRRLPKATFRKPSKPKAAQTLPLPSGGYIDVKVGDLWKRRDGTVARQILAVDDTYVTVASVASKAGTQVAREDFVKRYKRAS